MKKSRTTWWPAIAVGCLIVALWVLTPILMPMLIDPDAYQRLGVVGDSFGAINALFSGLAFAGLFYAILLQRNELELQRKELAETRSVLNRQKGEAEKQNATLSKQTFDNTFFQLLRLHNDIVQAIDIRSKGEITSQGRDCFKIYYRRFHDYCSRFVKAKGGEFEPGLVEEAYIAFYRTVESDLGHYFRSLYNIVKFVDRSEIKDKRIYTNLIRAQLSSQELLLIFYDCQTNLGREKFKPLVERYSLLKTVPQDELLDPKSHMELYAIGAFQGSE